MTVPDLMPAPMTPRHFWRRGMAFLLDGLLANVLAGFILLGVLMATGQNYGAAGFADSTSCTLAAGNYPLVGRFEALWPPAPGETREYVTCHTSTLGLADQYVFQASVATKSGGTTYTRSVTMMADADGNVLEQQWPLDLSAPLVVLILGWFTAGGRRPPGKMLMSLRLRRMDDGDLTLGAAIWREAVKQIPLLLLFAVGTGLWALQPPVLSDFDLVTTALKDNTFFDARLIALMVAGALVFILWWVGPFLAWRGQTWYDRITGNKVIKTETVRRPK